MRHAKLKNYWKAASFQFGNKHDAATNYVDAANCYKKNDPKEAAASLQKVWKMAKLKIIHQLQAIDIYTDMGRFTIAAKHHETIAGIFESEVNNLIILILYVNINSYFHSYFSSYFSSYF